MPGQDHSTARGAAPHLWRLLPPLLLLAIGSDARLGGPARAWPAGPAAAPTAWEAMKSLDDVRLDGLRRASASWDFRSGPARDVVDQVALVPDLATFLDVIATWDRERWFPVLIEDAESTPRFLRAFRPSRVVRPPASRRQVGPGHAWARALEAVGSAWDEPGAAGPGLKGDSPPWAIAPTPPGAVLSAPDAPMLAGAVALAAGRFQPLLRFDRPERYGDVLSPAEFLRFDEALTARVAGAIPHHAEIGDDCDFLTLAGDWPYRYRDARSGEDSAVDDAIARTSWDGSRWAFAGRLLGNPADSAYRAMCSLFLATDEATLFNGYDEQAPSWSGYSMREAATRLDDLVPTTHLSGARDGSPEGWHEAFDPWNRSGLVLVNSHGSPTIFHLRDRPCSVADVPRTVPSVVAMIHSFAAADPNDPGTIAGRWLANGAFIYFGSMNEPFLTAFRPPRLVADLVAERLPLAAALRQTLAEPYGLPWRLVYLGDPLFRVEPSGRKAPRLPPGPVPGGWTVVTDDDRPTSAGADDPARLRWARDAAIARAASGKNEPNDDLIETLAEIRRPALTRPLRPAFDAVLADALFQARRRSELRGRIAAIPGADRSPALRRWYESVLTIDLHLALDRGDFPRAVESWAELLKVGTGPEVPQLATLHVGRAARTPAHRLLWARALRAAIKARLGLPPIPALTSELARVEAEHEAAP